MKVAIISDTHGQIHPKVMEVVKGCELCVHAGDIGNADVLAKIQRHTDTIAILGNNDVAAKWPVQDQEVLSSLNEQALVQLPGGSLVVVHGHRVNPVAQRHEKLRQQFPDTRMIVYGHSHRLVVDTKTRPHILNPGAAGFSRTFGGASCFILTALTKSWRIKRLQFANR